MFRNNRIPEDQTWLTTDERNWLNNLLDQEDVRFKRNIVLMILAWLPVIMILVVWLMK